MAFLLAVLGAMGVAGGLLWRLNTTAEAAKGLAETAQDIAGMGRRWSWWRKANADPVRMVDDPRVGAMALMVAVAQSDGAMTAAERAAILRAAVENFGCTGKVADEMLAYGRFLVGNGRDPNTVFLKLQPLLMRSTGAKERADLVAMVRAVAAADGPAGDAEAHAVERIARELAGSRS